MSKYDELFSKEALSLKSLKKADKGERESIVELYLQQLTDYFFSGEFWKNNKKDRCIDLCVDKVFLKTVARIWKENPEIIPDGLAYMLVAMMHQAERVVIGMIESETKSDKPRTEVDANVAGLREQLEKMNMDVLEVVEKLTQKNASKLKKLGMKKQFAVAFAPAILPEDALTNAMFRYVPNFTRAIYKMVASAYVTDESGALVNTLGIDLTQRKTMNKFMEIVTKKMDIKQLGEFLRQLLLEKRTAEFDNMTKQQINVYAAITNYVLRMLDDKDVFSGKQRREIISRYGEQVARDVKKGRDAKRRVEFSEFDEETYPRIYKALKSLK